MRGNDDQGRSLKERRDASLFAFAASVGLMLLIAGFGAKVSGQAKHVSWWLITFPVWGLALSVVLVLFWLFVKEMFYHFRKG